MKVTLDQLKKLLATYRLKVLRIQPTDQGFLVETNKGPKAVTIWENGELLKWSNRWREEVALQGGAGVERFLTNFNKKKYIRYQGKYFVLSSLPVGTPPDPKDAKDCLRTGEVFAKYHSALDRIDQGNVSLVSYAPIDEKFFTDGSMWIKQILQTIEQKEQPSLLDEIVYTNLPLIYKRFRRAFQLWEGIKDSITYFPIATTGYKLEQIMKSEDGWSLCGGYNEALAPLHQDTVQLLRELYEKSGWNLETVGAFLQGYDQNRRLTDNEWIYILMQLAIPWEVWTYLNEYLKQQSLPDEQSGQLVEAIRRQQYWDDLAVFVAKVIDKKNEASA